ncbi:MULTISPECIES: hypothetical protein [unclassified Cellulophaga]|uniref:hypothetical protein n=1 Tax=unclassified Cellulophaga TaxID=2634405 RepID=UPI0026E3516F|nr:MULTISPECIES: hypothetical protein [unclassified Cellulophaga]MDO6491712.1 hypothetical protein [Cellulophaga sp. 2_MG-2023]MDO6495633.1 hypothetical protein [Cellulophaga sp. 3_MG-2023]
MKIKFSSILILITLISSASYAQKTNKLKMTKEVKQLIELGRDSIIKLALPLVDKNVSLENFSKTSVQSNGTEVYVAFSNPVMYLPLNTVFYDHVGVNLTTGSGYKSTVANPAGYNTQEKTPYYLQTESIKKNIAFICNAIDSFNYADIANFNGSMRILEKKDHYNISVVSETQESWYKVKKVTGKMFDEGHAHLELPPITEDNQNTFKEVLFKE